jgi:hypothetical protein
LTAGAGTGPRGPLHIPADATDVTLEGPRPFLTRVRYRDHDGRLVEWSARLHRKADPASRGLTWRIGMLFVIGSTCFLLGPIPWYADAVGPSATAWTYFVGSVFFTTAAFLSYVQVVRQAGRRWFGWTPWLMGFWAASIQFVGTLEFNVTTFAATRDLVGQQAERLVWRPDAFGSICFLVASAIAFAEAGHRWWSWRPGHRDWHITALNLWGSVWFGLSAVGAYLLPDGSLYDEAWANGGTFLGAACFLVAAILMLPEGREAPEPVSG